MAVERKKSLQTYLPPAKHKSYLDICAARGVMASSEIREFVEKEIKKHGGLLNE